MKAAGWFLLQEQLIKTLVALYNNTYTGFYKTIIGRIQKHLEQKQEPNTSNCRLEHNVYLTCV